MSEVPSQTSYRTQPYTQCRANKAHIRQSRPDSGLVFQEKIVQYFKLYPQIFTFVFGAKCRQMCTTLPREDAHVPHTKTPSRRCHPPVYSPYIQYFCSTAHIFSHRVLTGVYYNPMIRCKPCPEPVVSVTAQGHDPESATPHSGLPMHFVKH